MVTKRDKDVNYVIHTPDHGKTQCLCHVSMLKSYWKREDVAEVVTIAPVCGQEEDAIVSECIQFLQMIMMSSSYTQRNLDIL